MLTSPVVPESHVSSVDYSAGDVSYAESVLIEKYLMAAISRTIFKGPADNGYKFMSDF
jgi:hypothetical protein